jgi:uncharacterized protein (TIGR00299 family) protein
MARILYLDCFSGVSGDMLLGALMDLGAEPEALSTELSKLNLDGWRLHGERARRSGIAATKAHVELAEAPQPHRRLPDILALLEASSLHGSDREGAAAIFRRLAAAEASVHGTSVDEVEFHEVGSLDAIIDITAAVIGLRLLGIERLYASPLPGGSGTAHSMHGAIPVPAPATLQLMADAGIPLAASSGDRPIEMVTPTGAAILAERATFERPAMRVQAVGHGAGGRDPEGWPNVLRAVIGETIDRTHAPTMLLLETNIDDMSGELIGYAQELLFEAGAADVWIQPIQMKKNRPGVLLSMLCAPDREQAMTDILLRETSTLGVRVRPVSRHEAQREVFEFASSLGPAAVKVKRLPGQPPRVSPEYEVCRRIARERGMPLAEVYRMLEAEALERLR